MRLKERFLRIFGDIKLQPWPPFVYYEKGDYYKITGEMTAKVMPMLQPGDLILRGYDRYLDGWFIPGEFTHTGIYIGNGRMIHAVAAGVSYCSVIDFLRCDRICVLRPRCGVRNALRRLKSWLGLKYDYDFTGGNSAYYCHELAAEAYRELNVRKEVPYLLFLRFCHMQPRYLGESFINSPDFKQVVVIRPNKKRRLCNES